MSVDKWPHRRVYRHTDRTLTQDVYCGVPSLLELLKKFHDLEQYVEKYKVQAVADRTASGSQRGATHTVDVIYLCKNESGCIQCPIAQKHDIE